MNISERPAKLAWSLHPALRRLIEERAEAKGITLSEVVGRVMSRHFRRPDLAEPPRAVRGRPPKCSRSTNHTST